MSTAKVNLKRLILYDFDCRILYQCYKATNEFESEELLPLLLHAIVLNKINASSGSRFTGLVVLRRFTLSSLVLHLSFHFFFLSLPFSFANRDEFFRKCFSCHCIA